MNLKVSRDSMGLWAVLAMGLITYLMNTKSPTAWDYHEWLQFAAATVTTVTAKLMASPLLSKREHADDAEISAALMGR